MPKNILVKKLLKLLSLSLPILMILNVKLLNKPVKLLVLMFNVLSMNQLLLL